MLSKYLMTKIRPEKWKKTMICKAVKYSVLFIAVIFVTESINDVLNIWGIPQFGEFAGGIMLGMFLEKPRILYGALFGFVYAAVIAAILIMILSGINLPTDVIFKKFLKDIIFSWEVIKILKIPLLFALGTWLAGIVRKNEQKELMNP